MQARRIVTVHGPVIRVNDGFEEAHNKLFFHPGESFDGRVTSGSREQFTLSHPVRTVEIQNPHRHFADVGERFNAPAIQREMRRPAVAPLCFKLTT
jgi:hypothetical protein